MDGGSWHCTGDRDQDHPHGEENGTPLQYSCLENPRDRGAWWAAVYGVAQRWTQLKRLSSSNSFLISSASVRSILFLPFIEPIFVWNVPLVSLIFLKTSLVFPILLFSSIYLHWSLRKAFLSPCYSVELFIQMNISFLFSFAFSFSPFLSYNIYMCVCMCVYIYSISDSFPLLVLIRRWYSLC